MDYTESEGLAFLKHFAALCCYWHVLGLAGVESTFPIAARAVLCGAVLLVCSIEGVDTTVMSQLLQRSAPQHPGCLASANAKASRLGVGKRLGRGYSQDS